VAAPATVDEYIGSFPPAVGRILEDVRVALRAAVPGAEESISYGIPTLTVDGRYVVYFSGWKHHVAVYPIPDTGTDEALARDIAPHRAGKGTLRFPLGEPMPLELIGRVAIRLLEQRQAR
jgi:uncharacterized protein YdhG (YjbR/CyaY superfamily)